MSVEIIDGIPVWITRHRAPCTIRVKEKKPGPKPKKRKPSPLKLSKKAKQELNIKQREALQGVFEGKSKRQAGIDAGYSPNYASIATKNALEIASANDDFRKAMEKQGITKERLVKIMDEGLEAKNPFRPKRKDYKVIYPYFRDAVKLLDGFPASKIHQQTEAKHIHLVITSDDYRAVEKYKKLSENDNDREQREHRQETEA